VAGCAGVVVVPDRRGQGQDALQDAHHDSGDGVAAVSFEVELGFEGLVDRLDGLAQRLEQRRAGPLWLAFADGAQQCELLRGEGGFELRAVVLAVGDEGLPRPGGGQGGVGGQDAQQGLAFVGFGAGQREPDREAAERGDQVQAQAPEVPRVTGAVPVFGPSSQLRAVGRFFGPAAFHRGGINDPHVVGPQAGVGGQHPDQRGDQHGGGAQPPVAAGLARQIGEQVPQVSVGVADPPGLGGVPQQRLHHRQGDQLRVGQLGLQADLGPPRGQVRVLLQQVVGSHIECGREGVYVVRHTMIMDTFVLCPQPNPLA
jgi:hypothetical protein